MGDAVEVGMFKIVVYGLLTGNVWEELRTLHEGAMVMAILRSV
jgi:hypothetical protein